MAYVLYHQTLGVFLACTAQPRAIFWSRQFEPNAAPLDVAPCFDTLDDAAALVRSWGVQQLEFLSMLRPVPVVPDCFPEGELKFASATACALAGLPGWLADYTVVQLLEEGAGGDYASDEESQRWQRPRMN